MAKASISLLLNDARGPPCISCLQCHPNVQSSAEGGTWSPGSVRGADGIPGAGRAAVVLDGGQASGYFL